MARRFENFYRVKPRDNLGDPEYWNRRFEDLDRRVAGNEESLQEFVGLAGSVEGIALDRLNLILAPALSKIGLVSEQGFLLAHSATEATLTLGSTVVLTIQDAAERELFAPTRFLAITRIDNIDDYAFARRVSYSKITGELEVVIEQVFGNPGPFIDWEISCSAGVSMAIAEMLDDALDARDIATTNATTSTVERTAAQVARTAAEAARTGAETALASFNTVYHGVRTTAPSSGLIGSFYYDSDDQVFKVLGSDGWAPGHSVSFGGVVQQDYTVTAGGGQSAFIVDGGFSKVDVFKNGVQLKPITDFTLNPADETVTLTTAAPNGSWVSIRGYKEASSVDFYTKVQADAKYDLKLDKTGGSVSGALAVTGNLSSSADLKASSGILRLNSTGDRYLQWTGTVYALAGAGNIYHTGNFDPNTKLDKAGGTITGALTVNAALTAASISVGANAVWHAGNFNPDGKFNTFGGNINGDITVYRPGATNTGVIFLGSGTGRGLFWDGTNYSLLGSGTPWHTGNFDPNSKQAALGFTPVQQSGGAGQTTNKIYIGWSGAGLKAQVDGTDLGAFVFGSNALLNGAMQRSGGSYTGSHNYVSNIGYQYVTGYSGQAPLCVRSDDSGPAFMSFHRAGAFACQMGLDIDNYFKIGGWSDGAGYQRIYISPGGLCYVPGGFGAATGPVAGQVRAAGDIVYGLSDARLKEDIRVIENPLEKVEKLKGVTWKQNAFALEVGAPVQKRRKAGLLAQDLLEVLPEAVGIAPFDSDENEESKSGENYLNIQYEQTIGLLVECIKELKRKVEKLEG